MRQGNEASRSLTRKETVGKRRTEVLVKGSNVGKGRGRTASVLCHWTQLETLDLITSDKYIFMQLKIPWFSQHLSHVKF